MTEKGRTRSPSARPTSCSAAVTSGTFATGSPPTAVSIVIVLGATLTGHIENCAQAVADSNQQADAGGILMDRLMDRRQAQLFERAGCNARSSSRRRVHGSVALKNVGITVTGGLPCHCQNQATLVRSLSKPKLTDRRHIDACMLVGSLPECSCMFSI